MNIRDRQKRVAQEAAEWLVILGGEATLQQREQYVDWLRESPVHIAEMLRVAQVHNALEQFQGWSFLEIAGSGSANDNVVAFSKPYRTLGGHQPSRRRLRKRVWAAVAAMLLIIGATAVVEWRLRDGLISTDRGERREVVLADGSVIEVDPETRLRVNYETQMRRVVLERGRALFRVAKNSQRPFFVVADQTTVRAVGTAFAVEKNGNEPILITVSEGRVAVLPPQQNQLRSPPHIALPAKTIDHPIYASGSDPLRESSTKQGTRATATTMAPSAVTNAENNRLEIFLTANQQISIEPSGIAEEAHPIDSARALAWAKGQLIFEDDSVANAVRLFNRYNRIQILINDNELKQRTISGTFNAADPESFAAFIKTVASVRVNHNDSADIIIDKAT